MYYKRTQNAIFAIDGKDKDWVCQDFSIEKMKVNIITNECTVTISFSNVISEIVYDEFSLSECRYGCPDTMLKKTFFISDSYKGKFYEILRSLLSGCDVYYTHDKLGFHEVSGKLIYLAHESIGFKEHSIYEGMAELKSSGNIDLWLDMIQTEVLPHMPMFLALSAGFSSPITSLTKKKINGESLLISLAGNSTSGKTVALKLCCSIYTEPIIGNGIMHNFNDTENFRLAVLGDHHGTGIFFDEATTEHSLKDFVYNAAAGIGKGRANKDGEAKERKKHSGTIMLTCERSAVVKTAEQAGAYVRLYEFTEQFTKSEDHSDAITDVISENFGLAIKPFIEFLLDKGIENIEADYDNAVKDIKHKAQSTHKYSHRIIKRLAMLLLSGRYITECFCFQDTYNDNKFINFLVQKLHEFLDDIDNISKTDPWECLKEYVANNKASFIEVKRGNESNPTNPKGKIIYYQNGKIDLIIRCSVFKDIMRENSMGERTAIQALDMQGKIVRKYKGEKRIKDTLKGITYRMYHFELQSKQSVHILPYDESSLAPEELIEEASTKRKKNKDKLHSEIIKRRKSLLEDDDED